MKCKIRHYKLVSDHYDSRFGACYKKVDTSLDRQLNVYFDEVMYIEKDSDFNKDLISIIAQEGRDPLPLRDDIVRGLEFEVNMLLKRYRDMNLLFLESDLLLGKREKGITLYKEELFEKY